MIKKFWHVGLSVDNLGDAIKQYKQLGFELIKKFERPELSALGALMEHPDGSGVELFQWKNLDHPNAKFIKNHIGFMSDDQDADVAKLVKAGFNVVIPKTTGAIVKYVFLRDTSGNYIEIATPKE